MNATIRRAAPILAVLACTGILACDADLLGLNRPRTLDLWVASPHTADQAFVLRIDAAAHTFAPAPHVRHYATTTAAGTGTVLVVADQPLDRGETLLGSIEVRGNAGVQSASAHVLEVARSDFQLRETVDGYRIRLLPR